MGIPVLIIGKSGSGKSASLRNCVNGDFNLVKVLNKPLPFRGKIPSVHTDRYEKVKGCLQSSKAKSLVIDDAGYLITNQFMRGHSSTGAGNAIFSFYNELADSFWDLITFVNKLPPWKVVYFIMHEETSEQGATKAKTIGKLLDEKVCVEGMFTIVLRCIEEGGNHLFVTQSANGSISKTPMGMFESLTIDNDLAMVDKTIREYYELEVPESFRPKEPEDKPDEAEA